MQFLNKLKINGFAWFFRRLVAEFVMPKTKLGCKFKILSKPVYFSMSKSAQYLGYLNPKHQLKDKDTLYFFYDLDIEPITYDFAWALSIAEANRKQLNLKYLKIIIVPGRKEGLRLETDDYEKVVSKEARLWRLYSIVLPIVQLLSSRPSLYFCNSRFEASFIKNYRVKHQYPNRYTVEIPIPYSPQEVMNYGHDVLFIQASSEALRYVQQWKMNRCVERKLIVITLRQYGFGLDRNSNLDAWISFANTLPREIYKVVFVPDNETVFSSLQNKLGDFECFEAACWSIPIRAALYEVAYLNLGVNTGPMSLCWFSSKCRYITFKTITQSVPQTTKLVMEARGFIENENPLFTKPFQKWSWLNDDFENIVREFQSMLPTLEVL